MATANEIITDALTDIGAIDPLEALTASETAHGLRKLNELLESWSNERLHVYQVKQEQFSTSPGTSSYTIGPGGAWNTVRPLSIGGAFIRASSLDYPLDILSRDEFDSLFNKSLQFRPGALYYEPSYPLGMVFLYRVPDAAYSVFIDSHLQLQSFAGLTDSVSLPPGYVRAIKAGLAVELAPAYHSSPSNELIAVARESKAAVKRMNLRIGRLRVDEVLVQQREDARSLF